MNRFTFHFAYRTPPVDAGGVPILVLDVGGKNEGPFFDHHVLGCHHRSAVALLHSPEGQLRLQEWLAGTQDRDRKVMTHPKPDLDAVASCATVLRYAADQGPLHPGLVEWVSRHDQGEAASNSLLSCIATFFLLITEHHSGDLERLRTGIELMDILHEACETQGFLPGETALASVEGLRTRFASELRSLAELEPAYVRSLKSARFFTAPGPGPGSGPVKGIWLHLSSRSPVGLKNWLRQQMERAPDRWGEILVIRWQDAPVPRVVISCSPKAGIDLHPWGARLEAAETLKSQKLEGQSDLEPSLARIAEIRGKQNQGPPTFLRWVHSPRHFFPNNDPWYDGRGHGWTILDSPRSGTVLSDEDVREALALSTDINRGIDP